MLLLVQNGQQIHIFEATSSVLHKDVPWESNEAQRNIFAVKSLLFIWRHAATFSDRSLKQRWVLWALKAITPAIPAVRQLAGGCTFLQGSGATRGKHSTTEGSKRGITEGNAQTQNHSRQRPGRKKPRAGRRWKPSVWERWSNASWASAAWGRDHCPGRPVPCPPPCSEEPFPDTQPDPPQILLYASLSSPAAVTESRDQCCPASPCKKDVGFKCVHHTVSEEASQRLIASGHISPRGTGPPLHRFCGCRCPQLREGSLVCLAKNR